MLAPVNSAPCRHMDLPYRLLVYNVQFDSQLSGSPCLGRATTEQPTGGLKVAVQRIVEQFAGADYDPKQPMNYLEHSTPSKHDTAI